MHCCIAESKNSFDSENVGRAIKIRTTGPTGQQQKILIAEP